MEQSIYNELVRIAGKDNVRIDEPMKKHTTFRIGGAADFFVTPDKFSDIGEIIKACTNLSVPYYVVGNGSNLLVSDEGYRGVIIQIYDKLNYVEWKEDGVIASAGCLLSALGNEAARRGLSGFEFATGIPGTLGGAVAMNAGAYGGEIMDCLVSATVMDNEGNIFTLSNEQMEFGYRMSAVIKHGYIVLKAELSFVPGDADMIKAKVSELSEARRSKQPLEYPSAGSTFKRPEGYFAGKLIQDAGFKGYRVGGAMVSEKHSGFVINSQNATAKDVYTLINDVQQGVFDKFGVKLEMEVKCLGFF
ncbi:MAG: UDP-N-acetylmuramate dehydrogenase [Lachnospiraceae bacterium]